jgi:UDP-glucose 4-epimerase
MKATGGASFIGSHPVDRLLEDGHSVSALDSLSAGKLENVQHLKNDKRFALHAADLKDDKQSTSLCQTWMSFSPR